MSHIKAAFRYIDEDSRKKFSQSHCLLTISVGQEAHEDEKFASTIDLVNKAFKSCTIVVGDTLQRFTMAIEGKESPDALYESARLEGDRWLERNAKYYSKLSKLKQIIRWDQFLVDERYMDKKEMISNVLHTDSSYKKVFNETIDEFLQRYRCRAAQDVFFDSERAHQFSLEYLIEECAVMALWPKLNCQFDVYPAKRNPAMDETYRRFVFPTYPDLVHAVAIRFRTKKKLALQNHKVALDAMLASA